MDVHGTKLAPTLFTMATGVERRAAQQSLAADGAIACFSSNFIHQLNADRAPQLKASVGFLRGSVKCTMFYPIIPPVCCLQSSMNSLRSRRQHKAWGGAQRNPRYVKATTG